MINNFRVVPVSNVSGDLSAHTGATQEFNAIARTQEIARVASLGVSRHPRGLKIPRMSPPSLV